ncbi:sterol-4-alpha-carboxylate 3-dehydrogenase [Colletotrichum sojae]|uniref:Sterol-4-alpha-carboxylate 3-dehydrogenase n=1 Tax=Colletotrichum sojae TaxID=2175907 RepID=A0A8H6IVY3_9PEZI|nr:sterol-4-alpha-carboxylate 3-dehydrogenase [Colletotrichum sojae]
MESETFLVSGGCGFIGSHIVEKLLAKYPSCRVAVVSRDPTKNLFPGVDYHKGDVASADDVDRVIREVRPGVVFHCAGLMTFGRRVVPDELVHAVNVDGTRNVLEACKREGVKAVVTTSSASVVQREMYRDIVGGDESLPLAREGDDTLIYPMTKAASDKMTLEYDDPSGMRTCTLRPAAVHGERDNDITPGLMRNLRLGKHKMQLGDNTNLFSITYAGNAADAHLAAAEKLLTSPEGVAGEAFFITNGPPLKFWDFGRMVWKAAGDETKVEDVRVVGLGVALAYAWALEWVYWARGEVPPVTRQTVRLTCMSRWYVIDKAKERLGWEPQVGNEEGVRRAVEWFLENEKRGEGKGVS